jgi:hypothetical protein
MLILDFCDSARFSRFERLIAQVLQQHREELDHCIAPERDSISLRDALCFPKALLGPVSLPSVLPEPGVVSDGQGHRRPAYRGLLVYAWARAIQMQPAAGAHLREPMLKWCNVAEENTSLSDPSRIGEGAWDALALAVAAKWMERSDWISLAATRFRQIASQQQSGGALFPPTNSINPETRWYEELVLLHAMSTYAVEAGDAAVQQAVQRAAEHYVMESQPDHATQQPWAIFAFLSTEETSIQAEEILHTAIMRSTKRMDAISLVLLADALWCVQRVAG